MTAPAVAVAIVSWNTRQLLLRCLQSLEADARAGRAEVHVIDNRSTDGSLDAASREGGWVRVIDAGENLGYGRAVNRVGSTSTSEWVLAANADIALRPDALQVMLEAGSVPDVGCVAPRLVLPDGSTQHSVHPFPTIGFATVFNLGLHRLSRVLAERLCLEGAWDPNRPRDVPWAIGACMLLRREAFEAVGGFDEEQWMYAEDLDLCWRLQQAGWRIAYEPGAIVEHEESPATDAAFGTAKTARFTAATYAVLLRRRGVTTTWTIAGLHVLGAAARLLWMAPLAIFSDRWRARFALTKRWLAAHRQGLRGPSRLRRESV